MAVNETLNTEHGVSLELAHLCSCNDWLCQKWDFVSNCATTHISLILIIEVFQWPVTCRVSTQTRMNSSKAMRLSLLESTFSMTLQISALLTLRPSPSASVAKPFSSTSISRESKVPLPLLSTYTNHMLSHAIQPLDCRMDQNQVLFWVSLSETLPMQLNVKHST